MGRKLMRVPLDFAWPQGKTWEGYVNPFYRKCPACRRGLSPAGEWLAEAVQGLVWRLPEGDSEAAALSTRLCGREPSAPLGHDSLDAYAAQRFIREAAGMPENWGTCKACGGECQDPAMREQYDAWKEYDPPTGPGFQLWETTSEGSPISPVFDSLGALCAWAEGNASTFGSFKTTAAEWRRMLDADFVCHREGNAIFL